MQKENLDDYVLPYVDFYMEIPQTDAADYLNEIHPGIHDDHKPVQDSVGLSVEQVSEIRRDSLEAASQTEIVPDEQGLFSTSQDI